MEFKSVNIGILSLMNVPFINPNNTGMWPRSLFPFLKISYVLPRDFNFRPYAHVSAEKHFATVLTSLLCYTTITHSYPSRLFSFYIFRIGYGYPIPMDAKMYSFNSPLLGKTPLAPPFCFDT